MILDRTAHPVNAQAGDPAALAGLMLKAIDGGGGIFGAEELRPRIVRGGCHQPRTGLVSMEQTTVVASVTLRQEPLP